MPENVDNFEPLAWLEHYFDGVVHFDYNQLRPVLCFSMIWNLFESVACGKYADERSIKSSVEFADQNNILDSHKYQQHLHYFRQRCLNYETTDQYLNRLFLRGKDLKMRNVIEKALNGELNDANNIVEALLFIAYRIRNNLFHGNKEVSLLYMQTDLFEVVNHLLADYIDDVRPLYDNRPPR